jgi:hypothetical protein
LTSEPGEDYLAVEDEDPADCGKAYVEKVERNTTSLPSKAGGPPTPGKWVDVSPKDHFLACDIRKIQVAGGHANPIVYVLTTLSDKQSQTVSFPKGRSAGQIYRGVVTQTQEGPEILKWEAASGTHDEPLGQADNFFVNPFDANELYAVDVHDQVIKFSADSGKHWNTRSDLTDLASNHGEYVFGCNDTIRNPAGPFGDGCSMSWMSFDVDHPKIRVAAMLYGGIAFSRDSGQHWMGLDVTDNNHFLSNNLTEPVVGVFFNADPESTPSQFIYASLRGKSLKAVFAPFLTLESLNFNYSPKHTKCEPSPPAKVTVEILTKGLSPKIPLRGDATGICRGSLLFDSMKTKTIQYQYVGDGTPSKLKTHTLLPREITAGVANLSD